MEPLALPAKALVFRARTPETVGGPTCRTGPPRRAGRKQRFSTAGSTSANAIGAVHGSDVKRGPRKCKMGAAGHKEVSRPCIKANNSSLAHANVSLEMSFPHMSFPTHYLQAFS